MVFDSGMFFVKIKRIYEKSRTILSKILSKILRKICEKYHKKSVNIVKK